MEYVESNALGLLDKLSSGKDYYEIRLESIGGLGANLCGKMLGEIGLKFLGLNSSSFSSYGSEKTGTPVKGFVRYCKSDKEIRVHYPVVEPDLLIIFHQALMNNEAIWKGCTDDTIVIIATEEGPYKDSEDDKTSFVYRIMEERPGRFFCVNAQKIAIETKSRINVVMLGAALKLMGMESSQAGEEICKEALGNKYPEALKGNLMGVRRGFLEVSPMDNISKKGATGREYDSLKLQEDDLINSQSEWGYENAPIGGINPRFGSTVIADLSPSRQGYIPLFIMERCINCGLCHSTCPDMVFQFAKGEYKGREMMVNQGLDYYHCKGCLRCVDVCPVNALVRGVESEHPNKEYFIPNQELVRMPDYYEKSGPDGYITSESYLTEKRVKGGEV